jgi:hypothetical protein
VSPLRIELPFLRPNSAAERLLRVNQLAQAEQAFVEEAESHPRDPRPLLGAGHLALCRNDLENAQERLAGALARDRNCRDARDLLAEVSYRRGDFAAATAIHDAAGNRPVAAKLRALAGRAYVIEGPEVVRLPFVRSEPLPILSVRVNGGPERRFLLDTGGSEVILDRSYAQSVGLSVFEGKSQFFAGGKRARVDHAVVDSVALGDLTVSGVPVNVLDMAPIRGSMEEPELAGVIGTVLLYRFRATIDYPGGALILQRRGAKPDAPRGAVEMPILMADDHYVLAEGSLNDGPPLLLFIDTGLGGGAFTCPASTLKAAGIDLRSVPRSKGEGGGGTVSVRPFDIAALSLGKARRERLVGVAGPFPPHLEWVYGFRIGGLISHGFLNAYAVTFDFERMTIRLAPPSI